MVMTVSSFCRSRFQQRLLATSSVPSSVASLTVSSVPLQLIESLKGGSSQSGTATKSSHTRSILGGGALAHRNQFSWHRFYSTALSPPSITPQHRSYIIMGTSASSKPATSSQSQQSSSSPAPVAPYEVEIEELHRLAVQDGKTTYTDPRTGFMVFTELAHFNRGNCCGNQCRHCPYGWTAVPNPSIRRPSPTGKQTSAKTKSQTTVTNTTKTTIISVPAETKTETTTATSTTEIKQCNDEKVVVPNKSKTGGRHGGRTTDKNVPYTRGGDKGTSQLLTGERRSKADAAFEAMGTVDELTTVVGLAHAFLENDYSTNSELEEQLEPLREWLLEIMSRLFDIGSHVAKPARPRKQKTEAATNEGQHSSDDDEEDVVVTFHADGVGGGFDACHIDQLEDWIDQMTDELPELTSFILPTGSNAAAQLHVARTVCRRAERRVVPLAVDLNVCDPHAVHYLNRLSDFFFTAARWVNYKVGYDEILYKRPTKGSKQRNRIIVEHSSSSTTKTATDNFSDNK